MDKKHNKNKGCSNLQNETKSSSSSEEEEDEERVEAVGIVKVGEGTRKPMTLTTFWVPRNLITLPSERPGTGTTGRIKYDAKKRQQTTQIQALYPSKPREKDIKKAIRLHNDPNSDFELPYSQIPEPQGLTLTVDPVQRYWRNVHQEAQNRLGIRSVGGKGKPYVYKRVPPPVQTQRRLTKKKKQEEDERGEAMLLDEDEENECSGNTVSEEGRRTRSKRGMAPLLPEPETTTGSKKRRTNNKGLPSLMDMVETRLRDVPSSSSLSSGDYDEPKTKTKETKKKKKEPFKPAGTTSPSSTGGGSGGIFGFIKNKIIKPSVVVASSGVRKVKGAGPKGFVTVSRKRLSKEKRPTLKEREKRNLELTAKIEELDRRLAENYRREKIRLAELGITPPRPTTAAPGRTWVGQAEDEPEMIFEEADWGQISKIKCGNTDDHHPSSSSSSTSTNSSEEDRCRPQPTFVSKDDIVGPEDLPDGWATVEPYSLMIGKNKGETWVGIPSLEVYGTIRDFLSIISPDGHPRVSVLDLYAVTRAREGSAMPLCYIPITFVHFILYRTNPRTLAGVEEAVSKIRDAVENIEESVNVAMPILTINRQGILVVYNKEESTLRVVDPKCAIQYGEDAVKELYPNLVEDLKKIKVVISSLFGLDKDNGIIIPQDLFLNVDEQIPREIHEEENFLFLCGAIDFLAKSEVTYSDIYPSLLRTLIDPLQQELLGFGFRRLVCITITNLNLV